MAFIEAWANNTACYLNTAEIQRISFAKDEALKQSERRTKVLFKDGSKGEYIVHRNVEKYIRNTINVPVESAEQ